ncbi:MAG: hypothetical protein WAL97_08200 [Halobacteriota archaeon]
MREPTDNAPAAQTEAATYDPRTSRGVGVGVEPKGREDAQPLTAAAATAAVSPLPTYALHVKLPGVLKAGIRARETDKRFRLQL